jgi:hypothetical protein
MASGRGAPPAAGVTVLFADIEAAPAQAIADEAAAGAYDMVVQELSDDGVKLVVT